MIAFCDLWSGIKNVRVVAAESADQYRSEPLFTVQEILPLSGGPSRSSTINHEGDTDYISNNSMSVRKEAGHGMSAMQLSRKKGCATREHPMKFNEFDVIVAGKVKRMLIVTPEHLDQSPGTVLFLGMNRGALYDPTALSSYGLTSVLRSGHSVLAIDLPNHGDDVDEYGEGLSGIASAIAAGRDVVGEAVAFATRAVDEAVSRHGVDPERLVIAGVSRGAFFALHVLANITTIHSAALFAPVTHLKALAEFAEIPEGILTKANLGVSSLVSRLRDRSIYVVTNAIDPRVDAEGSFDLFQLLRDQQKAATLADDPPTGCELILDVTRAESHRLSDRAIARGMRFLIDALDTAPGGPHL